MYVFTDENGEVTECSFSVVSDIEVDRDFFFVYPSYCWKVIDGVLTLKEDADTILTDTIAYEKTQLDIALKEKETAETIANVTSAIDAFIQYKIDEYNLANGTLFKDINSISKYLVDTTYTHYIFCEAIIKWNIQVWETARQIQSDVLSGAIEMPTDITLELPELVY